MKNKNKAAAKEAAAKEKALKGKEAEAQKAAAEELSGLREELQEQKAALAKEKDDYLRLMAEFETFRRRGAEERLELSGRASADLIKGMLPVLDDCEQALKLLEGSEDQAAVEGTKLIYKKLLDYLKTRGLEPMEAKGQVFDTDLHEAVGQFPAGEELKGKVFETVQTGYKLSGKVLRYAKVIVGI